MINWPGLILGTLVGAAIGNLLGFLLYRWAIRRLL